MLLDLSAVSLPWLIAAFAVAVAVILLAGTRLPRDADRIAVLAVMTAAFGHTELAISNAIGGIAAQTALLALAIWRIAAPISSTRVRRAVPGVRRHRLSRRFDLPCDALALLVALTIAMTAVLLLGMLRREIHGFGASASRAAPGDAPVRWR